MRQRYRRCVAAPAQPEPRAADGIAISVRGLTFEYATPNGTLTVLDSVDCDIPGGATVAITGQSGSGKTTLLSVLGGLDRANAGAVLVGGVDLAQLDGDAMAAYRRDIVGFVFQDFGLLGQLTALENVELALAFGRSSRPERRARAHQLLTGVGLADRLTHRPRALSGGEKQRVAIARALANDPRLVLADEPTGNLDPASSEPVLDLLMRVPATHGCTVVVVTHDDAVADRADHRLHIVDGRVRTQ